MGIIGSPDWGSGSASVLDLGPQELLADAPDAGGVVPGDAVVATVPGAVQLTAERN